MIKPIAFAAAFLAMSQAWAADLVLAVGQVKVLTPAGKLSTVVVGDPTVAEVVVEGETTVLVLARKVGYTDVVMLGPDRAVLERARVSVAATNIPISDQVTVRRMGQQGVVSENLSCGRGSGCTKVDAK